MEQVQLIAALKDADSPNDKFWVLTLHLQEELAKIVSHLASIDSKIKIQNGRVGTSENNYKDLEKRVDGVEDKVLGMQSQKSEATLIRNEGAVAKHSADSRIYWGAILDKILSLKWLPWILLAFILAYVFSPPLQKLMDSIIQSRVAH